MDIKIILKKLLVFYFSLEWYSVKINFLIFLRSKKK